MKIMLRGSIHLPQIRLQRDPVLQRTQGQHQDIICLTGWKVCFFIMNEIKHLFDVPPNFHKYSEADETLDAILRHQLPTQEIWARLIQLIL